MRIQQMLRGVSHAPVSTLGQLSPQSMSGARECAANQQLQPTGEEIKDPDYLATWERIAPNSDKKD